MEDLERDLRDSLRALMASEAFLGSASLTELGWAEVFEDDPRLAVQTLFEEAGRAAVATGGRDVLVSLMVCDGRRCALTEQDRSLEGVADDGLVTLHRAPVTSDPDVVLVLDRRDGELLGGAEVEPSSSWSVEEVIGAHEESRLRLLSGQGRLVRRLPGSELHALDRMVLLALSHERCGVALGLLDVAVGHVAERQQFGVPIGSLQAVQHRLAGVKVAVEAALSSLEAAWDTAEEVATLVAAAAAATALAEAVRDCLQVCGGMGFTDEFPLAPLMRRAVVLQGAGPSAREAESLVGRRLVEAGVTRIGEIDRIAGGRVS